MKKVAVITTRYVIENHSSIVSVFKDDEGDWQFFGSEQNILEEDARVISLEEILNIDSSVKDVLDINNGTHAWRDSQKGVWNFERYEE